MNPQEKLRAYNTLKNPRFNKADHALLKKKNPNHELSILAAPTPIQYLEILHALLDYATVEEITASRGDFLKEEKATKQIREKDALLEELEKVFADNGDLKPIAEKVEALPKDHLYKDELTQSVFDIVALQEAEAKAEEEAKKKAEAEKKKAEAEAKAEEEAKKKAEAEKKKAEAEAKAEEEAKAKAEAKPEETKKNEPSPKSKSTQGSSGTN